MGNAVSWQVNTPLFMPLMLAMQRVLLVPTHVTHAVISQPVFAKLLLGVYLVCLKLTFRKGENREWYQKGICWRGATLQNIFISWFLHWSCRGRMVVG